MRTRGDNIVLSTTLMCAGSNLVFALWLWHWWSWVAVLFCLVVGLLCERMRMRRLGYTKSIMPPHTAIAYTIEHGQLKAAPKPFMLTPEDEFDWFCTCPACYWLGNHPVEIRAPEIRTEPYPGYDDDSYVVGSWQNPNIRRLEAKAFDYGWIAQRTCYMCGHTWKTPANAPEE